MINNYNSLRIRLGTILKTREPDVVGKDPTVTSKTTKSSWLLNLFLMAIIYRIYINSSLLLINPLLSFKFAIYEIEYVENEKNKNGLIISRNKYLQDDADIKIYEIGHKLYFATDNN